LDAATGTKIWEHKYASRREDFSFGDIFSDLFGSVRGRGEAGSPFGVRGRDLRYSLEVDFLEAATGAKKRVTLPDGGILDITVPEGVPDGQVLRLKAKGSAGVRGAEPGDALVEIRVRPSLFAIEDDDRRRLIFLELREKSNAAAMRVVAELAFEAFRSVLCNLPPSSVQVIDVRRGYVTELQQAGTAIGHELANACREISYVWPRLAPPKESRPIARPTERPTERQMSIPWDFDA
jgi:hypothetical protein